jgi:hypothetical protein
MRRGEVWWAGFGERWPVVLLSEEEPSRFRAMQVVARADTDISGLGVEVPVGVQAQRDQGIATPADPGKCNGQGSDPRVSKVR